MTTVYRTKGTCSRQIDLTIEEGIITDVKFYGGCNGNLQGISRLVIGQRAEDVAKTLKGVEAALAQ